MRLLDLFSGIGGFSLGLERAGFQTVAFCEIEPFPRRVLAKHWPEVPIYDDVRTLTAARLASDGIVVDAICGGFPCQDISHAGNRAGMDGTRSGLWSEIARLVSELQPRIVFVENVAALLSGDDGRWFGRVLGDLAALGYDAEWHCIPASAVGAPHRRDRVWIVAYPDSERREKLDSAAVAARPGFAGRRGHAAADVAYPDESRWNILRCPEQETTERNASIGKSEVADAASAGAQQMFRPGRGISFQPGGSSGGGWRHWQSEPDVGRVAHGIPERVDRLAALGNAVVPQVVEMIGRAIMEREAAQ